MSTLQTARVYCLLDSAGQRRYVGSTVQPLEHRLAQHQWACRDDPTACPLYRSVASLDDWTIVALMELQYDAAVFPHASKHPPQHTPTTDVCLNSIHASEENPPKGH
eukprot:COSAG04_NODE_343_length_16235_cov_7.800570_5_plen_107_part_00